jgi:flagellar basal-body rod modification protein FlgD
MTAVAPITPKDQLIASMNAAQPTATPGTSAADLQTNFLTLLTTQLQNQDPLNPLDNNEVTSELAQISTVSGIDKLNTTITQMTQSLLAAQQVQASSLIGHGILSAGSGLVLQNSSAAGGVSLDQAADHVTVKIFDANGKLVRTLDLGAAKAGVTDFTWDGLRDDGGKASDGAYTFQVAAAQGSASVNAQALALGLVQSVTLGSQGLTLNAAGLGAVAMTDVKQIL